jgi:TM2 domain-containing membrane protein YozV
MIEDETMGPLTEGEFAQELYDGKIGPKVRVMSPTRTKSSWYQLQQLPTGMQIRERGESDREQLKREEAAERERQRAVKAEQKRQKAEELARQRELEARRKAEQERSLAEQRKAPPPPPLGQQNMVVPTVPVTPPPASLPAVPVRPPPRPATATFEPAPPTSSFQPGTTPWGTAAPSVGAAQTNVVVVQQVVQMAPQTPASNTVAAVLLNMFLLPGIGQLIQGRTAVGAILLVCWIVSLVLCFFCIGWFVAPVVWLVAAVDAATH